MLAPGATASAAGVQWWRRAPSEAPPPKGARGRAYKYLPPARASLSARLGRPHVHQPRSAMKLVQTFFLKLVQTSSQALKLVQTSSQAIFSRTEIAGVL